MRRHPDGSRGRAPTCRAHPAHRRLLRAARAGPWASLGVDRATARAPQARTTRSRIQSRCAPGGRWPGGRYGPGRRYPRTPGPASGEPVLAVSELGVADPHRVTLAAPGGRESGVDAGSGQLALEAGHRLLVVEVDAPDLALHELAHHAESVALSDDVVCDDAPRPRPVDPMEPGRGGTGGVANHATRQLCGCQQE